MPNVTCWKTPSGWVASCDEHGEEGFQRRMGCPTCDKLELRSRITITQAPEEEDA